MSERCGYSTTRRVNLAITEYTTFFSRKMGRWMDGKEFRQMKMEVIFSSS